MVDVYMNSGSQMHGGQRMNADGGYMEQEEEWEREGLLDPAWEKQQRKVGDASFATSYSFPNSLPTFRCHTRRLSKMPDTALLSGCSISPFLLYTHNHCASHLPLSRVYESAWCNKTIPFCGTWAGGEG